MGAHGWFMAQLHQCTVHLLPPLPAVTQHAGSWSPWSDVTGRMSSEIVPSSFFGPLAPLHPSPPEILDGILGQKVEVVKSVPSFNL